MRGFFRKITSFCFILYILLSFSIAVSEITASKVTIYTRITEIELPPRVKSKENYPNWTFFEFDYIFEIINPVREVVYVPSTSTCLFFMLSNLSFENDQYSGNAGSSETSCGQAFTDHPIEPGINNMTYIFTLEVNSSSLESIPNGNFSIWICLDDYLEQNNYHYYKSEISVNETNIQITHQGENVTFEFPKETTPIITLVQDVGSVFSAVMILIVMWLRKLLLKKKKNNRL